MIEGQDQEGIRGQDQVVTILHDQGVIRGREIIVGRDQEVIKDQRDIEGQDQEVIIGREDMVVQNIIEIRKFLVLKNF